MVQVGCPGVPGGPNLGAANAGIAIANIIAAITRATVNTKSMRLIDATSFTLGRDSSVPLCSNATSMTTISGYTHDADALFLRNLR